MTPQELNHKLMILRAQKNIDGFYEQHDAVTQNMRAFGCEMQNNKLEVKDSAPSDFTCGFVCGVIVMTVAALFMVAFIK